MTLRISGKNMDIGEALRTQVQERVDAAISKYFDGTVTGHVTIEREGSGYRADCVLHLPTGVTLESGGIAHEAPAAFDQAAHRIEKRLRRHKRRLRDYGGEGNGRAVDAAYSIIESPAEESEEPEAEATYHPVVIAETTRKLHRRSVSQAVLELDFSGSAALVFLHAGTGRVNVVYRRHDGAIGWIDPSPEPSS